MDKDLYGEVFYACFANGEKRDEQYPFHFHNEYELVLARETAPFLKKGKEMKEGPFIYDKLDFFVKQKIYYAVVGISGYREARKTGEYGKWYKLTFTKTGRFSCKVSEITSATEAFFSQEDYRCDIECLSKEENSLLSELYRVYPDGKHIHEGKKENFTDAGLGALISGTNVGSILIWHCTYNYYLCAEFYDNNNFPIGLFDMCYHPYVFWDFSDQNVQNVGNWNGRVPITVFISHFHSDHFSGLLRMVNNHNVRRRTFAYFFANIDLHIPDTFQPPSFGKIIATIRGEGGNAWIYDDNFPFSTQNAAFDYGLGQFNHPVTGKYYSHPHLHGMYVRCTTAQGTRVLIAGDTVYRGIGSLAGPGPRVGDLAGPYDVLVACHHGGDYAVSIARSNLPNGVIRENYIPVPSNGSPVVIYSANGNGSGSHPNRQYMQEHQNMGWGSYIITNKNYNFGGAIPQNILLNANAGYVDIG